MNTIRTWMLLALLVTGLRGQEVLVEGATPGAALFGPRGAVIQVGRVLHLEDGAGGTRRYALPPSVTAWDLHQSATGLADGLLAQGVALTRGQLSWFEIGREPVRDRYLKRAEIDDFFRGRPDAGPRRLPLIAATSGADAGETLAVAVPGLSELVVFVLASADGALNRTWRLPLPAFSEQSLGYGLGWRMTTELRAPAHFVHALGGAEAAGRFGLIARQRDRWTRFREGAEPGPFGPTSAEEEHELLDFAVTVPPRAGDFDGDGQADLLVFDPGGGYVLNFLGQSRAAVPAGEGTAKGPEPDQVIRTAGWIFRAWSTDLDGDGREDLALLQIPRLNLIEQVKVIREAALPVTLEGRLRQADGRLAEKPYFNLRGSLPVALSMTRNDRRIRPRLPLMPLSRPGTTAGLIFPHEGAAWRFERGEDGGWTPAARVLETTADAYFPFAPKGAHRRHEGRDELLLMQRGDAGGGRVLRLRP